MALSLTLALAAAAHGDPQHHDWYRIDTPDFELLSDLQPPDAQALADRLTRFRLAVRSVLREQYWPGPPVRIIAFRDPRDFRRVFSLGRISGFTLSSISRYTLAFGPDGRRGYASRALTAFHEYTHYLLHNRQPMHYPAWYEEGYANFLSTVQTTRDGVVVGHVPPIERRRMARSRLTVAELLNERFLTDWKRRDLEDIYLKAWLLVHMLQHGHLAGLPPFHERVPEMLAMIDAGTPSAAAVEASLGMDLPAVERLLGAYSGRALPTRVLDVDVEHETPLDVQPVTPTESRQALADAALATNNNGYASQLYRQVLKENPDDIDALVGLSAATDDPERSLEAVRRALSLDANHPGANIRMAQISAGGCDQETLDRCFSIFRKTAGFYRRAVRSDPDSVEAAFGLGVTYLHVGQPGNALGYLRVAYLHAPWTPSVNLFLGEAYRMTGDVERARVHLEKAMHWHRQERWRERAAQALSMIEPIPHQD